MDVDQHRFDAAAERFKDFFEELNGAFAERVDVLRQIALALLAREHVLLCGPPGTAKSQLASAVFGRIVDETTGQPSLYSRQIGESTVRTDLVGPIDFKTLMETGRSEHFTDEGMLGAVHAFLDEVFDGRDMLLRDALNVLQERELKQGTRVVAGRIECALMTSNRYLVEVLEDSRDMLLAFVDRIAFAGFVPRGFADEAALPSVLKRHVGGSGRFALAAPLSVQDIDALQTACESVEVPDEICERLAQLLARFDAELLSATRADPSFLPTRYVSTRTAVRAGKLLRAIAIYRTMFEPKTRDRVVEADDLRMLHLHLTLSGPAIEVVDRLIANERDPRERRQLKILQTERMLFDRALATLPEEPVRSRPRPKPISTPPRAPNGDSGAPQPLNAHLAAPLGSSSPKIVIEGIRAVVTAMRERRISPADADVLLARARATLTSLALASTLQTRDDGKASPDEAADALATFADELDAIGAHGHPIARFLRGRALAILDEAHRVAPSPGGEDPFGLSSEAPTPPDRARSRLAALTARASRRERLIAKGADVSPAIDEAWKATVARAEEELVVLWDHATSSRLGSSFRGGIEDVSVLMYSLRPALAELTTVEKRLAPLGCGKNFRSRVVGPRIRAVLEAGFERLVVDDRKKVLEEIGSLQRMMVDAQIADAVSPDDWVRWAAEALLASERAAELSADVVPGIEAYSSLREREHRRSNAVSLTEVVLQAAPVADTNAAPSDAESRVSHVLASLPEETRTKVIAHDLARIDRAISLLESWWTSLGPDRVSASDLKHSKLVKVLWEDGALLRFALEGRALATLFGSSATEANALTARAEALHEAVRSRVDALMRERVDAAWNGALGRPTTP